MFQHVKSLIYLRRCECANCDKVFCIRKMFLFVWFLGAIFINLFYRLPKKCLALGSREPFLEVFTDSGSRPLKKPRLSNTGLIPFLNRYQTQLRRFLYSIFFESVGTSINFLIFTDSLSKVSIFRF